MVPTYVCRYSYLVKSMHFAIRASHFDILFLFLSTKASRMSTRRCKFNLMEAAHLSENWKISGENRRKELLPVENQSHSNKITN
jgi:hypothetical protein